MTPQNKRAVIDEIAWRAYTSYWFAGATLIKCREAVERDYDLLGVREFSAKYERLIHQPK